MRLITLLTLLVVSMACGPTEEDIRELVRAEVSEMELRGPEGPQGVPGTQGRQGPPGPPWELSSDVTLDTLTVKALRVIDEKGDLAVTVQKEENKYPAIRIYGEPGQGSSLIYGLDHGEIVLKSGDTYLCVWKGQAGVCERSEEGYLKIVQPLTSPSGDN